MSCNKNHKTSILIIHPAYTFGGAERTLYNLIKELTNSYYVILITSKKVFSHFPKLKIKFIDIDFLKINVWYCKYNLFYFIRDAIKITKIIYKIKPKIVLGMMYYASTFLALSKIIFKYPSKVIVSPRGPMLPYYHIFHNKKSINDRFIFYGFKLFCKFSDHIIVPSTGMKEEAIKLGARANKITVIPNSVDLSSIRTLANEPLGKNCPSRVQLKLVTAGRMAPEKDIGMLLKVLESLKKHISVHLIIIGDGFLRNEFEKMARQLRIDKLVTFTGFRKNPFKFFKWADLYVHACLFEGFGNCLIESLAVGTPVIATNCPYGPRDIIKQGYNGFLVEMGDITGMMNILLKISKNKSLLNSLKKNALKSAQSYGTLRMVSEYAAVFNNLI